MKPACIFLLLVTFGCSGACGSAPPQSPPPERPQNQVPPEGTPAGFVGAFTADGDDCDNQGPECEPQLHWSKTYTFFADGRFTMSGYPPLEVSGRFEFVEGEPPRLRLYDRIFEGSPDQDVTTDFTLSDDGQRLTLGEEEYHRTDSP